MNNLIYQRIKSNLIIIIIVLLVNTLLIFFCYHNYLLVNKEAYSKNIEHGISKCSEVLNDLDIIIYRGENIVELTVRDYKYLYDKGEVSTMNKELINQTFEIINMNTHYFQNLYLADDNNVICAGENIYESYEPRGREWYDLALERGDIVITNPYRDAYTEENVVTISKSVGINKGVIGLDISQEEIYEILRKGIDNDKAIKTGFIINRDGIIIASTDNRYTGMSVIDESIENSEKLVPYYNELLKNNSGQIDFDQDGYAYSLVYLKTASDWHVAYVVDKKIMGSEAEYIKQQTMLYLILSFVMLNTVVLVYYYKRQRAVRMKERAENAEQKLINYKDQLEQMVQERTEKIFIQGKKIEELNTAIIDNLADIVEFRDLESGQHIKRIKKYVNLIMNKATEIYPEYEKYKDDIEKICDVSALHDIGKIGISDAILLKPAKLTSDEFEEMKKHTVIGGDLASKILDKYDDNLKQLGYEICRYHHERYDGNGYPEGLKGEEIPFCAQAVGIADVYDALIEKRVYKEPFSHERAIEMIINGECGKFSDKIISCLRLVEGDFKIIIEKDN